MITKHKETPQETNNKIEVIHLALEEVKIAKMKA